MLKYLILILFISCSRPSYLTITNVTGLNGKRYVYGKSRWMIYRGQDDTLKRGDRVYLKPCNEKHDSIKGVEFIRIK